MIRTIKIKETTFGNGKKLYLPLIYIETTETITDRGWFKTTVSTIKKTREFVIGVAADNLYYEIEVLSINSNNGISQLTPVDSYDKALELIEKLNKDIETRKQKSLANTIVETKFIEVK